VDPKRIAEILADLANASEADIRAALAAVRESGKELATNAATPDNVKALKEAAASAKALSEALTARSSLADDQRAALEELDGVHDPGRDNLPQPDPADPAMPDPEEVAKKAEPEGGEGKDGADDKGKGAEGDGKADAKKTTTTKTSRTAAGLGALSDKGKDTPPAGGTVAVKTTVSNGVPGFHAGTALDDTSFLKAFAAAANAKGGAGRVNIAHAEMEYPAERQFGDNAASNTELIRKATDPAALVAAGGLCLPPEVRYDINVLGVTDRPVKQALNSFQTSRGVLQYRAPMDALTMTSGLGLWTQAMDQAIEIPPADPDTNVYKSCFVVDCPGVLEASIFSTYMCLEFPNMTARFDQEWVRATTQASQIAWARFAENQLLTLLFQGSKMLQGIGGVVSAIADVLATYDRVIAYYRNRHRLNDRVSLRTILPLWVVNLLQTDLARRFTMASPGELFGIAQAEIERWFSTRGVNITWHLDGLAGGTVNGVTYPNQFYSDVAAGAAVPKFPTSIDSLLYVEGDWLFLDGGTLDLGLVRDSELNKRNRYQTFMETFEGVAFTGKESLRINMPLRPDGSAAGTKAVPAGGWD
jgi:hypothetical protein